MSTRIFITGMGVISAIGNNVEENQQSLAQGKCGISRSGLVQSKYASILPFGGINSTTEVLQERLDAREAGVTRTTILALHAFKEAIKDAGLTPENISSPNTALIGATTVGGMCLTDELYKDAHATGHGSPYLSSYDCASVNMYLQERYHMKGIINTINTACSSSANAIMYGARLIKSGRATRVIAGGVDSLAKFTINGFNALHILSPDVCAPFDRDRKGLNLGEGAAFVVMEKEEVLGNKKVIAELSGYGNANDAYHPSSLSDDGNGPYLSMKTALENGNFLPADIGFINAHGTATENNDLVESRAMLRLFGKPPAFASTKSNIGHTLGAAGAVEAVFSVLCLTNAEVYPGLHFDQPITETGLSPVSSLTRLPLNHVMSNSFGFGGNCSSLIFSKV